MDALRYSPSEPLEEGFYYLRYVCDEGDFVSVVEVEETTSEYRHGDDWFSISDLYRDCEDVEFAGPIVDPENS
jgi:hypothetical protein